MILDELDRLEAANIDLAGYRDRFYETDKQCAVFSERIERGQKDDLATDLIFTGCMTVGGVVLGALPSLWSTPPVFWTSVAIGVVLIGIGIAAKIVKYR